MLKLQPKATEEYGKFAIWLLRLFILITAVAGLYTGFEIYKSNDSGDWPSVSGMIERSWRTVSPTLPNVRYTYSVEGKIYRGDKVAFRDLVGAGETKRVLSRYPIGKKVDVYFNPNNHDNSVLEPGYNKGSGVWVIIPWIMFLIGMFLHRHVQAVRLKAAKEAEHIQN